MRRLSISVLVCSVIAPACGGGSPTPAAANADAAAPSAMDAGVGDSGGLDASGAAPADATPGSDGGAAPDASTCAVTVNTVTGSTDFYGTPRLAVDGTGAGVLAYAANGASTGSAVTGVFLAALGAGGAPAGSPSSVYKTSLLPALAPAPNGFALATSSPYSYGVVVTWLDAGGAPTRTETIPSSSNDRLPSIAVTGGVTYVAWVVDAFDSGASGDALWIAGFDGASKVFGPTKLNVAPTTDVSAHLVVAGGAVYLVYSGSSNGAGSLSWSKIDAAGNVAPKVDAAEAIGSIASVAVHGTDLAYAAYDYTQLTATGVEIRAAHLADGAIAGTVSLGKSGTTYGGIALAGTTSGYAAAAIEGTGAAYLALSPDLSVVHDVPLAGTSVVYSDTSSVGVAATTDGAVLAWGNDKREVLTAHVACP